MNAQQAYEAGMIQQGQYVVVDPTGRVVRITSNIFSFAAITYRATQSGLVRVC